MARAHASASAAGLSRVHAALQDAHAAVDGAAADARAHAEAVLAELAGLGRDAVAALRELAGTLPALREGAEGVRAWAEETLGVRLAAQVCTVAGLQSAGQRLGACMRRPACVCVCWIGSRWGWLPA